MREARCSAAEPPERDCFDFAFRVDLAIGPLRSAADGAWWTTRTPDGPGTLRLSTPGESSVEAAAWGPGRHWLLRQVPRLLGSADRPEHFIAHHDVVRRAWQARPLRMGRTDRFFDAAVAAVLGNRVQMVAAQRSLALLRARHGEAAPGPRPQLRLLPSAAGLAALTYPELHICGVERSRAEVLRRLAAEAPRLETAAAQGREALSRRLLAIRGVGPWTTASVLGETLGDPDAVLVGDYHMPHLVCWALAGEARGSDARMLELLQPYAGQRARVVALLFRAGVRSPRRGPRLPVLPVDRYDGRGDAAAPFLSRRPGTGSGHTQR